MSLWQILHLLMLAIPFALLIFGRPLARSWALNGTLLILILSCSLMATGAPVGFVPGAGGLAVDGLSICLFPFTALLYLAILLCTPRAERQSGSTQRLMLGLGLDLITFSLRDPLALAVMWVLTHLPLVWELGLDGRPAVRRLRRILLVFWGGGCLCFVAGCVGLLGGGSSPWALLAITLGIVLRKAIVPFHQWLGELFEYGPPGHVVAFLAPQVAAYASLRLLVPVAPEELLVGLAAAALVTGVYGACLACAQTSFRRVYAGLFMGQTSLVFAGLQCTTHVGLTGGLLLWLSGGLALTGLGLTVWALEARRGPLSLHRFHGGYDRSPVLAGCFVLFGLTSCGFPGTLGFVAEELVLEGSHHLYPHVGLLAAVTASLNGVTVMRSYFRLFCGQRVQHPLSQSMRPREHAAALALVLVLLGFSLIPQPLVHSRAEVARQILELRTRLGFPSHH